MSAPGSGFLKFNSLPPRLHITADDEEFDEEILQDFKDEGFDCTYLPWKNGGKAYKTALAHLADDLELGESYAIIAYASAAADCLDFHVKPQPKLAALVAYYPTHIPSPKTKYPPHLEVLVHIAGTQGFAPAFPSYTYQGVQPGFAEHDLEEFNGVAASLAWSRALGTLRKAFKLTDTINHEAQVEQYHAQRYISKDALATMSGFAPGGDSYVNNVPTMTGGIGASELFLFYRDYFINKNPPSLRIKLVSRTMGVDRVVDEMVASFKHTQEVPWMLPGVKPTNKTVHVALVSIVCIRGGKLAHEHIYWDQATVLVQVGLLDPKLVPEPFKKQGLKRLPVYGSESAAKVLDEESQPSNDLIPGWKNALKSQAKSLPARPKQSANGGHAGAA